MMGGREPIWPSGVEQERSRHADSHGDIDIGIPRNDGRAQKRHDHEGGRIGYLAVPHGAQAFHVGTRFAKLADDIAKLPERELLEAGGRGGEEEFMVLPDRQHEALFLFALEGFGADADSVPHFPALGGSLHAGRTDDDIHFRSGAFLHMEGREARTPAVGAKAFQRDRPAVVHEPDILDALLAHVALAHLFLPYLRGVAVALHAHELRAGKLHSAPEGAAHHQNGGHTGEGNAARMEGREFAAVAHEAEHHHRGQKEHGRQDLRHDAGQAAGEILEHKAHARPVVDENIHALNDLGQQVETEAKAHDEQEQAGVALENVAEEKAHAEASFCFLRALQLAHSSVMRGILS